MGVPRPPSFTGARLPTHFSFLPRMLLAQRREVSAVRRREIVYDIQRYLADKRYHVWLPMWPRHIANPWYVKGFKHIHRGGLRTRLICVWLER
jgi:hypothetical protein